MPTENLVHLERGLMRVSDGERSIATVEIGDEPARLERHRHLALEPQLFLDDDVSFRKSPGWFALFECKIECDIVTELGMDHRRALRNGLPLIADRRERVPFGGDSSAASSASARLSARTIAIGWPCQMALGRHEMLRGRPMTGPVQGHATKGSHFGLISLP